MPGNMPISSIITVITMLRNGAHRYLRFRIIKAKYDKHLFFCAKLWIFVFSSNIAPIFEVIKNIIGGSSQVSLFHIFIKIEE